MPRRAVEATGLAAQKSPPPLSGDGFLWPVQGQITSPFGPKPNGARNDGINIRAAEGTPVRAAENGVVVYAGDEIPGYGRMLLISHADGLTTAYAHNQSCWWRWAPWSSVARRSPPSAGPATSPRRSSISSCATARSRSTRSAHLNSARTRIASAS